MTTHLTKSFRLALLFLAAASFHAAQAQTKNAERVSLPGSGYEVVLNATGQARVGSTLSPELVSAMTAWLSSSFDLPLVSELPQFQFVAPEAMLALRHRGVASDHRTEAIIGSDASEIVEQPEILAVYDDALRTIYLGEDWNGGTAAELSIVVHELVHHIQNVGQMKFACPDEREKGAYEAQQTWLNLFDSDLLAEFELDPFTVLARTTCTY